MSIFIKIAINELYERIQPEAMELLYELTYKYQILKQEMESGDFGLGRVLNDRAYLEFEKIKAALRDSLNSSFPKLVSGYREYIDKHLFGQLIPHNIEETIWEAAPSHVQDELQKSIISVVGEDATEEEIFKNQDVVIEDFINRVSVDDLEPMLNPDFKEGYDYVMGCAEEWNTYDLGDKIICFQYALSVAHVTGFMADWVVDPPKEHYYSTSFLDDLSNKDVSQWDKALERVLGHPVNEVIKEDVGNIWTPPYA